LNPDVHKSLIEHKLAFNGRVTDMALMELPDTIAGR